MASPNGPTPEELHAAKVELVAVINKEREAAGMGPLVLDSIASEAADVHCSEMVENNFSSHWNLKGEKPYQRYFHAGCRDHVTEIFGGYDAPKDTAFDLTTAAVLKQMTEMHEKTMGASSGDETHDASNVLDPLHTHVGIGVAVSETSFRMLEVYLDRYVRIDDEVSVEMTGTEINFKGSMVERDGNWGPYACVVYYDEPPVALTGEEASSKEGYEDFSHHQCAVTWPWEMQFSQDGSFSIPIRFDEVREGSYYVHLHVRDRSDEIPYDKVEEGLQVPGDGSVISTGFVFRHKGKPLRAGEGGQVALLANAVTDIRVATSTSLEGKTDESLEGYEKIMLGDAPKGTADGLAVYFAKGQDENAPVTDVKFITGDDPEMDGPEGYEVLRVRLGVAAGDVDPADDGVEGRKEVLSVLIENAGGELASNSDVATLLWESEDAKKALSDVGIDPNKVREALEGDPDGSWKLADYVASFGGVDGTPAPGAYTYLCVKRGEISEAITDFAVVFGNNPKEMSDAALSAGAM